MVTACAVANGCSTVSTPCSPATTRPRRCCTATCGAVLFDPAVYHGDRETDLAMTELFGGFDPAFYAAYREAAPLAAGYAVRRDLYNLYHVLNHVNLFGGGYAGQAQRLIDRLLAA